MSSSAGNDVVRHRQVCAGGDGILNFSRPFFFFSFEQNCVI
jgi:hypothetical protein